KRQAQRFLTGWGKGIGVVALVPLAYGCAPAVGYVATGAYLAASNARPQTAAPAPPPAVVRPTPRPGAVPAAVPQEVDEVDPWAPCPCTVDGITLSDEEKRACHTQVETLRSVHQLYRQAGRPEPPEMTAIYVRELGDCVTRAQRAVERKE